MIAAHKAGVVCSLTEQLRSSRVLSGAWPCSDSADIYGGGGGRGGRGRGGDRGGREVDGDGREVDEDHGIMGARLMEMGV